MLIDPANPVAALCAAGMAVDGDASAASALFRRAWNARRDDLDASIAAHFVARHQLSARRRLRWNQIAYKHGKRVPEAKRAELLPSLCLNLADSLLENGRVAQARKVLEEGMSYHMRVADTGYSQFLQMGLNRLHERLTRQPHM